jgi:transposase-like protein
MTDGVILRTDAKGRVVVTPDRRAALLEEFSKSGMSGAQFAKWAGVNYSTFAYWVQQRRKEQRRKEGGERIESRGEPGPEVRWLEAVVAGEEKPSPAETTPKTGLVMHGPGGVWWKIEGEDQARMAAVMLRHLGATC